MKSKVFITFMTVALLISISIVVQANAEPIKVIYNGSDVTAKLQPFTKNSVAYTDDFATVKMISPIHDMQIYPVFQKLNGKWVQKCNIFTNTDWQETMNINFISTEAGSNTYLISRTYGINKVKLDTNVLVYPGKRQTGMVYYGKPITISGQNYPNSAFFKDKLQKGSYSYNAVPIRSFLKSIFSDAEINFDNATKTITINCNGAY